MGVHITYMYVLTVEHYLQGFHVSFCDQDTWDVSNEKNELPYIPFNFWIPDEIIPVP